MRDHNYRVYFMASTSRVPYIGMTNNLERRVWEHQHDLIEGFSKQYRIGVIGWLTTNRSTGSKMLSRERSNSSAGTERKRFG
jgi:putative endonuclease